MHGAYASQTIRRRQCSRSDGERYWAGEDLQGRVLQAQPGVENMMLSHLVPADNTCARHACLEQHKDAVAQRRVVPRAPHERRQRAQGAGVGWLQLRPRGQRQEQLFQNAAPAG